MSNVIYETHRRCGPTKRREHPLRPWKMSRRGFSWVLALLGLASATGKVCNSGVWDSMDGDWDDSDNWVQGIVPSGYEAAFLSADSASVVSVGSDAEASMLVIQGDEPVVIEIGEVCCALCLFVGRLLPFASQ